MFSGIFLDISRDFPKKSFRSVQGDSAGEPSIKSWRGLNPEWLTPEWVPVLVLVVLVVVLVVLAVVS